MNLITRMESSEYLAKLEKLLSAAKGKKSLYQAIVNAPFSSKSQVTKLGLGIVVLLLVNKKSKTIDRIALSDTYHAVGAVKASAKPFKAIKIPLSNPKNIIGKAIRTGEKQLTDDWQYLFVPALTKDEARYNQAGADINFSIVEPLHYKDGAAMIFSFYRQTQADQQQRFTGVYSTLVENYLINS